MNGDATSADSPTLPKPIAGPPVDSSNAPPPIPRRDTGDSSVSAPPKSFLDHVGDIVGAVGHGMLMSIGEYRANQREDEQKLIQMGLQYHPLLKNPSIRKAFKSIGMDDQAIDMIQRTGAVNSFSQAISALAKSGLPGTAGMQPGAAPSSGGTAAAAEAPLYDYKVDSKGGFSAEFKSPKTGQRPSDFDKLLDELNITGEERRQKLRQFLDNKLQSPAEKEAMALDKAIQMMDARERSQLRLSDEKPVPPNALKYVRLPDGSSPKVGVTWGQLKGQNAVVPQSLMEQFTGALKELAGAQGTVSGQPEQPAAQPIGNTGFVDVTGQ